MLRIVRGIGSTGSSRNRALRLPDIEITDSDRKKEHKDSTCRGVYWAKARQRWVAKVTHNYKTINIGRYDTEAEACFAVVKFEQENPPPRKSKQEWSAAAQRSRPNGRSKYKGVCFVTASTLRPWLSRTYYMGVLHRLGLFATEEAAARAYDKKCLELRGPEARLNFPVDKT